MKERCIVANKDGRRWQGIPAIEKAEGGRLWISFFSGGPYEPHVDNEVFITTSADEGRNWVKPYPAIRKIPDCRTFDACLWHDPDGRLWMFYNQSNITAGKHAVMAMVAADSNNEKPQWSNAFEIELNVPFAFRLNKPTVTKSGDWLLPVTWADHPVPDNDDTWWKWYARNDHQLQGVAISRDKGKTWFLTGAVKAPSWALENMIVEKNDGSLWMLIRTGDGFLWECYSHDHGLTWSEARRSMIVNPGSRFFIRRMRNGKLLLINHADPIKTQENPQGRNNLSAMLSGDDGESWSEPFIIDERNNVSYPDAVEDSQGVIHIVYDRERYKEGEIIYRKIMRLPE